MKGFKKMEKFAEQVRISRVKRLWNEGYNSMEIAGKLHQPIERVQEWIRVIVADGYVK